MEKQSMFQMFLREELERRQCNNSSYSMRAFSKSLSMNHSALSEILNGKRKVGKKLVSRILDRLYVDPEQKNKMLKRFGAVDEDPRKSRKSLQLEVDKYKLVSDWYFFAILSFGEVCGNILNKEKIKNYFGLNEKTLTSALSVLERLGLINALKASSWSITEQSLSSPDGVESLALKKNHSQNLKMAEKALLEDDLDLRDFSAMTMAIDPKKIPEAKKRIRIFRDELCEFLESDEQTEVYKICIQLFTLKNKGK